MLVLSGGHHHAIKYHPSDFMAELQLIRNFHGPIIGICMGFELLAYQDGAKFTPREHKVHGMRRIDVVNQDPIFEEKSHFSVFESHRWEVKSPLELETLAESEDGSVEVARHKRKPIYGFQFHPELVAGGIDGRRLFTNAFYALQK